MDNLTIMRKIDSNQNENKEKTAVQVNKKKILIFKLKDQNYALFSEEVKEIVLSNEIFFVPFTPSYIKGFINRHGEPFTVFDLNVIFNNEKLTSNKFLVLNIQNDQAALIISDVVEILNIPENDIHKISSKDDNSNFFKGSLTIKNTEVLILKLESIFERLENDI